MNGENNIKVQAEKLTKKFGSFVAVDNIGFRVAKGECFGFLGPNGAGKTTTMSIVHCILPLTAGKVMVAGMDVTQQARSIKKKIGVAPQDDNLDPDFTVLYNLIVYARYFDIPRSEALTRCYYRSPFVGYETPAHSCPGLD
jgi:lipooligosaccharide transport system ATP-binding protein